MRRFRAAPKPSAASSPSRSSEACITNTSGFDSGRDNGSWLNLVEGFFAKAARSVLRHIRVGSKHELKQRIMEFIDDLNRDPVIHRWQYQIDATA